MTPSFVQRFRSSHRLLPWAVGLAGAACVLPSLDLAGRPCPCTSGYTCNAGTNKCEIDGAASGPGGGSTTGQTNASSTSVATGTGTGGTGGSSPTPSKPLVLESTIADGTLSLSVEGSFRIQSTAASRWQWSVWNDLANGSGENLASTLPPVDSQVTSILFNPMWVNDGSNWFSGEDASVASVDVASEAPARATVQTTLLYALPGLEVDVISTVYASGRIASRSIAKNVGATPLTLATYEYNYISVNPNLQNGPMAWTKTSYNGLSAGFIRSDGSAPKSSLLMVNLNGDTSLVSDAMFTNWYWGDGAGFQLMPGGVHEVDGDMQLGPGEQSGPSHAARAADVLSAASALEIVSGATPIGSGYDPGQGAYAMTATDNLVSFGAKNDVDRFSPAFVIEGFNHAVWRITLGGQEIVSSASPLGVGAVAYYEPGKTRLVLVSLGHFAQGALNAERIFTLEGM